MAAAALACCCLAGFAFLSLPSRPEVVLRGALRTTSPQASPPYSSSAAGGIFSIAVPVLIAGVAYAARQTDSPRRAANVMSKAFDPSNEIGALPPLGYWDPAGFMKGQNEEKFLEYRAKELKHGRIAMLAIVGFLVQPYAEFGIGFSGVPGGVQALWTYPGSAGFACLFLAAGFFELRFLPDLEKTPGNFGDPLKLTENGTGAYDERWRNFEIQNGRLAMIGAMGTLAAGYATGLDAYGQWAEAKAAAVAFVKLTIPFAP